MVVLSPMVVFVSVEAAFNVMVGEFAVYAVVGRAVTFVQLDKSL